MDLHEAEERDFGRDGDLWDATPGVCCAYYQLGACAHTEGDMDPEQDEQDEQDDEGHVVANALQTFEAIFPKADQAFQFAERLRNDPAGNWVVSAVGHIPGRRKVTWSGQVPMGANSTPQDLFQTYLENVGYYGSSQSRKATLNGVPAPMSY